MATNPDAAQLLEISFAQPREGSCLPPEILAELASLLRIKLPNSGAGAAVCVSKDTNNLAQLDAQNCVLVPAAKLYREEQTWDVSSGTDLDFEDFAASGFDATTCMLAVHMYLDSAETGIEVQKEPTGTVFIRPNFEIKERSAGKITIGVQNAASDVRIEIELLQLPVPPQQP